MKYKFNFIELIVVAATFILLLSVLIPALNRTRINAREKQCMFNLKKIGDVVDEYYVANKKYPKTFPVEIEKMMIHFTSSFACPSDENAVQKNPSFLLSYGMNSNIAEKMLNNIPDIDNTAMITETTQPMFNQITGENIDRNRHKTSSGQIGFFTRYLDGSVRFTSSSGDINNRIL